MTFFYSIDAILDCRLIAFGFLYLIAIVALYWPKLVAWLKIKRQVSALAANWKLHFTAPEDLYAVAQYKEEPFDCDTFETVAMQSCLDYKKKCKDERIHACVVWAFEQHQKVRFFAIPLNGTEWTNLRIGKYEATHIMNTNIYRCKLSDRRDFLSTLELYDELFNGKNKN